MVPKADQLWRDVKGWPGYWISDQGLVLSWKFGGKIMVPQSQGNYLKVNIGGRDGENAYISRMVLEAFVGPGPDMDAHHKDDNPMRNVLSNLEWLDRSGHNKITHG